ncbi:MAG TPA: 2-C-methyl-D-erythritol 4-phosphate cytidylyltransferase [Bacteroidales bacterium]|nr:2-C-methyl-D-erythritol 4-phosphate cytidylyltransferase [Bacteroidales bacterium]
MNLFVVIVAGGSGKRMGTETPKQFLELAGRPVLMHTIERFHKFSESIEIITVLPENQLRHWTAVQKKYDFKIPHTLVKGGDHRFSSVKHGLEFVSNKGLVAIHDGVRPLVRIETIKRCFEEAEKHGNAIPVISPADSLRYLEDHRNEPINRLNVKQVQTPQVFDAALIKKAYSQPYDESFTDDATVLEKTGVKIRLVEGNRENIKITNPEDLFIAQTLLPFIF